AQAIAGLELVSPMLVALRNSPSAQQGLKDILNDQTLNFNGALNDAATQAFYTLIFKADGTEQANARNPAQAIAGLELVSPMLVALRNSPSAQQGLKDILNDQTLNFNGALSDAATQAFYTLIFKADGTEQANARNPAQTMRSIEIVAKIVKAINDNFIDRDLFVSWTTGKTDERGKSFDLTGKGLPAPVSLNPGLERTFGKDYLERLGTALFTLADYMDYLLVELKSNDVDLNAFNTVYGLHSLTSSFSIPNTPAGYEVAGVLFMVISSARGDFKQAFNVADYARSLPFAAGLVKVINSNSEYREALNFFHRFNLPLAGEFSLHPKNSVAFGRENFAEIGKFLFTRVVPDMEKGFFNAEDFLEMYRLIWKNRHAIDKKLQEAGERPLLSIFTPNPETVGLAYRIIDGQVSVSIFDAELNRTKVGDPAGIARLTVTFVAQGGSLKETGKRWVKDSDKLRYEHLDFIHSVSVRREHREGSQRYYQTKYYFFPEKQGMWWSGKLFKTLNETYDTHEGKLLEQVLRDKHTGFEYVARPDWAKGEWVLYDNMHNPIYIPRIIDTQVVYGSQRALYIRAENHRVEQADEKIYQNLVYYQPTGKVSRDNIERVVSLAGGDIKIEEDNKYRGARTTYLAVQDSRLGASWEALGLFGEVTTYNYQQDKLSRTTFNPDEDLKYRDQEVRIINHTEDLVNELNTEEEMSLFNIYRKLITDHLGRVNELQINKFEDPFRAGFGVFTRADAYDVEDGATLNEETPALGLRRSSTRFLDFNEFGGVTFLKQRYPDALPWQWAQIEEFDGRGDSRRKFEHPYGDVRFDNGRIISGDGRITVTVYNYVNGNGDAGLWRSMRIAHLAENKDWDEQTQREGKLRSYTVPEGFASIDTRYGSFNKTLKLRDVKVIAGDRNRIFREQELYIYLATGDPVHFRVPAKLYPGDKVSVDVNFSRLGFKTESRKYNYDGVLEVTRTQLDSRGVPLTVYDEQGRAMPGRFTEEAVNPAVSSLDLSRGEQGHIRHIYRVDGEREMSILLPAAGAVDQDWRGIFGDKAIIIKINYDNGFEGSTEKAAYEYDANGYAGAGKIGRKIGEISRTKTKSIGEGYLEKTEYGFDNG
ncbi:MAG: hypothetical protein WC478_05465, partial [Candidatus Omnitrophota bacterium]